MALALGRYQQTKHEYRHLELFTAVCRGCYLGPVSEYNFIFVFLLFYSESVYVLFFYLSSVRPSIKWLNKSASLCLCDFTFSG